MMRHGLWLILLCLAAGCLPDADGDGVVRIACLGDSNTQSGWPDASYTRWCERAAPLETQNGAPPQVPLRPVTWTNYGIGGADVCDHSGVAWAWGPYQLQEALADHADVVVAAFGTNVYGLSVDDEVACYLALQNAMPANTAFYVALTPPAYVPDGQGGYVEDPGASALNTALRAAFPANRLVDFYTAMPQSLYTGDPALMPFNTPNLIHLDNDGQQLRAQRAVAVVQ